MAPGVLVGAFHMGQCLELLPPHASPHTPSGSDCLPTPGKCPTAALSHVISPFQVHHPLPRANACRHPKKNPFTELTTSPLPSSGATDHKTRDFW